jgi:hypothetical protein
MQLEEIKTEVKKLTTEDRRKLALFILELEKQHVQDKIGPQIVEDLEGLSKAVQDTIERIKKHVNERW